MPGKKKRANPRGCAYSSTRSLFPRAGTESRMVEERESKHGIGTEQHSTL